MEKAERKSPLSNGCSHCLLCSSSPVASIPTASNSAFPESGALFPKTGRRESATRREFRCISPSFHLPQSHPAQRRRKVSGPNPSFLDAILERPHHKPHLVIAEIESSSGKLPPERPAATIATSIRTLARSKSPTPSSLPPNSAGPGGPAPTSRSDHSIPGPVVSRLSVNSLTLRCAA